MGVKLRERPGKGWYVLIDWKGKRKAKAFGKNKALAKDFAEKMEAKLKLGTIGVESKAGVSFEDFGLTWLDRICHTRKTSTFTDYDGMFNLNPAVGVCSK